MSAGRWTAGPWRAGLGSVWSTPGEQLICAEVSGAADANLIAAAPGLHAAGESAVDLIGSAGIALAQLKANGKIRLDPDSRRWLEDVEAALSSAEDVLNAALAKATQP